jgi:hypothetical protein
VEVGVWCAVSARIIVPVYFNKIINCKMYTGHSWATVSIVNRRIKIFYGWFQEDSATAHIARMYLYAGFV